MRNDESVGCQEDENYIFLLIRMSLFSYFCKIFHVVGSRFDDLICWIWKPMTVCKLNVECQLFIHEHTGIKLRKIHHGQGKP